MTSRIQPQLSHCGIYARDPARLAQFYIEMLGMVVSDQGRSKLDTELIFLTGTPGQHHQLVIASGRAPQGVSTVNQLAFKVPDLESLKELHRRVVAAGIEPIRVVSHGNALSFYCQDPEGNGVEIYVDTPWYVPQPHGEGFDIEADDAAILADAERGCRESPGFKTAEAWQDEIAGRLDQR